MVNLDEQQQQATPVVPQPQPSTPGVVVPQPAAVGGNKDVKQFSESANLNKNTTAKEDLVAAVAYIAGQTNYFIRHVIYSKTAIPTYKRLQQEETKKAPDKQVLKAVKLNSNNDPVDDGEEIEFTKEYSQTKFRTFCNKEFMEVYNKDYKKVVLAETKPEYIVVKNLMDKANTPEHEYVALNEKLTANAAHGNIETGLFVIKRKDLVAFMVATSAKYVPILCDGNKDVTHPNGKIISNSRDGSNGKIYDLVYIKRDMETSMPSKVKTLLEIGVPYAVNKDQTEANGTIGDLNLVVNKEQVEDLYGKFDFKKLGTRKSLKKDNFPSDEAYAKAKKDCIIEPSGKGYGKKFAEIGLSQEDVEGFRSKSNRKSNKGPSIDELFEEHYEILRSYTTTKNTKKKNNK